jgi:hypothetical protein
MLMRSIVMLSVPIKFIMLSVMLSVVIAECRSAIFETGATLFDQTTFALTFMPIHRDSSKHT